MNWLERASGWVRSLFAWNVRTVEPAGSQPLRPNDWTSQAGRDWLNKEAQRVAEKEGLTPLVCRQEGSYGGGPVTATAPVWMFGAANAAQVIERCMLAYTTYAADRVQPWIDAYLASLMQQAIEE